MSNYFRPSVTVDLLIFDWTEEILSLLLIQRAQDPFAGSWALPGGFIEPTETLEASARRELLEETGLKVDTLIQMGTYGDPGRDPRGRTLSVVFASLIEGKPAVSGQDDASDARWFAIYQLPALAFDHAQIISDGLKNLKSQLKNIYSGTPLQLNNQAFLPQKMLEQLPDTLGF